MNGKYNDRFLMENTFYLRNNNNCYPPVPPNSKGYQEFHRYTVPKGYVGPQGKQVLKGYTWPKDKQVIPGVPLYSKTLKNLVDGNNTAALRGINCPDRSYTMGQCAVALGIYTTASGNYSLAEGQYTKASGFASHAEGNYSEATGTYSHAEGDKSIASGNISHAEGEGTSASFSASHAEGHRTISSGFASHAEGAETVASGATSHVEGAFTTANGKRSHAEGYKTNASGDISHAEGSNTLASGEPSHAEGQYTKASGFASHAEGNYTEATGSYSHAEGDKSIASGNISHAEGEGTSASFSASHAEGHRTISSGFASHAEGAETVASGATSHAEGAFTAATGKRSHAEGYNTSTNNYTGAHIMGKYGDSDAEYSWYLANGTSTSAKGLAAKILSKGRAYIDFGWHGGGADYAEMFETYNGKSIDAGYFISFENSSDRIRKTNASDDYILGVTSVNPVVLGDSGELRWKGKYITDEWGKIKYETVTILEERDKDGNVIVPEHTETQPLLNPRWNNSIEYIPRSKRPEWVAVGLLGKILIRDDGTCEPGGYCKPNKKGIATVSDIGYRVLKRVNDRQILILFR